MPEPLLLIKDGTTGAVTFDSRDAYAGVCVGFIDVAAGTTPVVTYSAYPGRTAIVMNLLGSRVWGVTIDDTLGYPRLTFANSVERQYLVFIQ